MISAHRRYAILLLTFVAMSSTAREVDAPEIYLHGEKPVRGHESSTSTGSGPIELGLARDEIDTILIRMPQKSGKAPMELPEKIEFKLDGIQLKTYWVASQRLSKSSFAWYPAGEVPEIAVPVEVASRPGFHVPSGNLPTRTTLLFELHVPENAKPGERRGELSFRLGGKDYSFPIRARVFSTTLPKAFALTTSFGWDPSSVMNKHFGKWNDGGRELNRQYFSVAGEHRIDLHKIYVKFPEKIPVPSSEAAAEYDPLVSAPVPDDSFLGQWKPLADGTGSPYGYQWSITNLPVPEEMKTAAPETEPFWRRMNASVIQHELRDKSFVYYIDEPKKDSFSRLASAAKKIRAWAPEIRLLVTAHFAPELDGAFDIWCPNLVQWDVPGFPSPSLYEERKKKHGEKLWFYTGCNAHGCGGVEDIQIPDLVTDRPAAYALVFPWIAFRYHADGILYYDTVYGYQGKNPGSPWEDSFAFTGYGEGNLFYPCNQELCGISAQEVLPSLRMKILRSGLQDAEILRIGKNAGLPVDDWVKTLIPSIRRFPTTVAPYEELKEKVLSALEKRVGIN